MSMGLEWVSDLMQGLLSVFPRPTIVRATHSGVKWRFGKHVVELKPGLHIWWPLTSEICLIAVARQTHNTRTQTLMTKDKHQVVAGGVVVYRIKDVLQAIGKRNWDVDTTVNDITQAAIVEVVTSNTLDDLISNICTSIEDQLTRTCRRKLRQFGVYVNRASLTDFSTCKTYNLTGGNSIGTPIDLEE